MLKFCTLALLLSISISAHAAPTRTKPKPKPAAAAKQPAIAKDPSCVKLADLPGEKDGITIDDGGQKYVECDLNNLPYRVRKSLLLIKNFGFIENPNGFSALLIMNAWDFFKERVKHISLETSDPNHYCKARNPVPTAFVEAKNQLTFCNIGTKEDDAYIAGVILHEARHAGYDNPDENDPLRNYSHVICEHGELAQAIGACDTSMIAMGSYDVSVHFAVASWKNEKFSQAMRLANRGLALNLMENRFNEYPLGTGKGLVLVRENRQIDFYDGYQTFTLLKTYTDKLKVVSGLPGKLTFLSKKDLQFPTYAYDKQEPKSSGLARNDSASKKFLADFKDVTIINKSFQCFLFSTYAECAKFKNPAKKFVFKFATDGKAVRFFQMPNALNFVSPFRLNFVVTQEANGKFAALELPQSLDNIDEANLAPLQPHTRVGNIVNDAIDLAPPARFDSLDYRAYFLLRDSGNISALPPDVVDSEGNNHVSELKQIKRTNIPGVRTERMIGDFYWGEDVEAI